MSEDRAPYGKPKRQPLVRVREMKAEGYEPLFFWDLKVGHGQKLIKSRLFRTAAQAKRNYLKVRAAIKPLGHFLEGR